MNAHFQPETIGLDQLKLGTKALVASIDWDALDHGEAYRLKHFGFDEGVAVETLASWTLRPRPDCDPRRTHDRRDPAEACGRGARRPRTEVNPLPLVAVAGSPNAGKSALFNALTGARQKVAQLSRRNG